jgi:hypothetical protein
VSTSPVVSGQCIGFTEQFRQTCSTPPAISIDSGLVPAGGGTATNMRVQLDFAAPAGSSYTATLRVNGTPSALACTVPAGAITCSNTSNSVALAAGDFIQIQVTSSPTNAFYRAFRVSFRY